MTAPLNTRSERVVAFVMRRWRVLLLSFVALVAVLGYLARDIKLDNGLRIWFEDGDPVIADWDEFKHQFGNDEFILIAATDPTSVFSPAALERVRNAANALEEHPKIRRVTSIANGRHIDGDAIEIRTEPLLADGPVTEETAAAVRERVAANPVFRDTIYTDNEKITLMIVEMATLDDIDAERPKIVRDVRAIAKRELGKDGGTAHVSGMGVVYEGLNAASLRDSAVFMTLSYVVVFLGLWLLCRRAIWLAAGGAVITLGVGFMVGLSGAAGRDLNMVTAILPTLLMSVGILDLIHLLDAYDEGAGGGKPTSKSVVVRSLALVIAPCAFNTLTDMLGFAALAAAPMNAVRDFGWLAAIGLGALFLILLMVGIPTIARFGGAKPRPARKHSRDGVLLAIMARLSTWIRARYALVLVGSVIVVAVAGFGISRVTIDTYTIGFLHDDDPVKRDHDLIEREFGPFVPYEFTITAKTADGIKDPELLRKIERVERAFEQDPRIGRTTGLPEILTRINQVVMDGALEEQVIPDTREAVAQELLLYETDERNELDKLADNEMRIARITARGGMPSVARVRDIIQDLERVGQEILGDDATIEGTGYMGVYVHVLDNIARTQISTFAIALALITLAMIVLLRSFRLGLIALIPNLLPVAMTLAVMGYAHINLDVATVLIASIVIGISVNDTTHMMFRFRHELAETPDDRGAALHRTLLGTGRAVIGSSIILAIGFSVLMLAEVKSISHFGLLCSVATVFALIADLIVTPAVLLAFGAPSKRRSAPGTGTFPHDEYWTHLEDKEGTP